MTFTLFPLSLALLKLASVLFLIFVFVPAISGRETGSAPIANFAIDIPSSETSGQALVDVARSYAKSFWTVFRVAFPLMILAAALGAVAIELIPEQALVRPVSVMGIIVVAVIS